MAAQQINLNTASVEELKGLPSITENLAYELVRARPFKNWEDIRDSLGLSDSLVEELKKAGAVIGVKQSATAC